METMAIIAYHQPVTRAEIEDIRGVAVAKGTVDTLLEAGWIKPRGRNKTPGRPLMWGTTDEFLDHFGLASVKDLPGMEELKSAGLLDRREGLASLPTGTTAMKTKARRSWSSNSGSKKAGKAPNLAARRRSFNSIRRAAERVATGKVGRS